MRKRSHKEIARMGGLALNSKLTKKQRSESARRAAQARWKKYRKAQKRT